MTVRGAKVTYFLPDIDDPSMAVRIEPLYLSPSDWDFVTAMRELDQWCEEYRAKEREAWNRAAAAAKEAVSK